MFTTYWRIFHTHDHGQQYGRRTSNTAKGKPTTIHTLLAYLPAYGKSVKHHFWNVVSGFPSVNKFHVLVLTLGFLFFWTPFEHNTLDTCPSLLKFWKNITRLRASNPFCTPHVYWKPWKKTRLHDLCHYTSKTPPSLDRNAVYRFYGLDFYRFISVT